MISQRLIRMSFRFKHETESQFPFYRLVSLLWPMLAWVSENTSKSVCSLGIYYVLMISQLLETTPPVSAAGREPKTLCSIKNSRHDFAFEDGMKKNRNKKITTFFVFIMMLMNFYLARNLINYTEEQRERG